MKNTIGGRNTRNMARHTVYEQITKHMNTS